MAEDLELVPKEHDIKNFFLDNKFLFNYLGKLGENRIVFEKSICNGKVRADALLFTENKGIIGIEFKTKNDTLKRLPRQLTYYVKTCNYVFVFCDDIHTTQVEQLLKQKGLSFVGIISYTNIGTTIIAGMYREAKLNPKYSLYSACELLWKNELAWILRVLSNKPARLMKNAFKTQHMDLKIYSQQHNHFMESRLGNHATAYGSHHYTYKQLIDTYVRLLGTKVGTQIICESFIYHGYSPDHYLKLYDFGDRYGKYYETK